MSDIKAARKNTRVDCCLTRSPNEQKFLLLFSEKPCLFEGPNPESERNSFFFEKKKQKTFICFGFGFAGWAQPCEQKVFWFFFSKKSRFFRLDCFSGIREDTVKQRFLSCSNGLAQHPRGAGR